MICLQPFTPIYKQEDYHSKVNLSASSTNSTISVSTEMTTESTDSTEMTVVNDNSQKIYKEKYRIDGEIPQIEVYIFFLNKNNIYNMICNIV